MKIEQHYNLVVVGSTPAGVACAVRAAREGLTVLLTNHHDQPGGMITGGLGGWETLYDGGRAPIYQEVRDAIFRHYRETYGEDSQQYEDARHIHHGNGRFEPFVGVRFFQALIDAEENLTFLHPWFPVAGSIEGRLLRQATFQHMEGTRRVAVTADAFCDCTYEGDLMHATGIAFRLGRESRAEFGEKFAGRVYVLNKPVGERDPVVARVHDRLNLRHVGARQLILDVPGDGVADSLVQAINYRTILSADPANRVMPQKPVDYDPSHYAGLEYRSRVSPMPNNKVSWNRPQLVGLQNRYAEGDWEERREVMNEHWKTTVGLLYYLQNDAPLDPAEREDWRRYGFAKDEGIDETHPPKEIYVREGRRLVGRHTFTEHDVRLAPGLERSPIHGDSVAVSDWYLDSHSCTLEQQKGSMHEGKMMLHGETFPGHISYRCLLARDVDNFLSPVGLSASHVGWGSVRLEVCWMNVAESAAVAVLLSRQQGVTPAEIDPDALLRSLCERRVLVSFFNDVDVLTPEPWIPAVQYFGTKGFFPTFDARPHDLVDPATAAVWAEAFSRLHDPGRDPHDTARAVFAGASVPIDGLARELAGLTRAQACQFLYKKNPS